MQMKSRFEKPFMNANNIPPAVRRLTHSLQTWGIAAALFVAVAPPVQAKAPREAATPEPAGTAQVQVNPIANPSAAAPTELQAISTVGVPSAAAVKPAGTQATGSPYGLRVVWGQGDLVARTTLLLLALMSMGSWYIIVAKLLEQRRQNLQALAAQTAFTTSDSLSRSASALAKGSPFRFMVESAFEALRKYKTLSHQVDVNTWLSQDIVRSVSTLQMRMQTGLAVLATVGSTAPFVGLFGTVWGIYNALVTIGATGQASIDKVAGPVGESLIMTALGLAVAVPAVLGYNWLVRRNRTALHTVKGFGSDLHTLLLVEVEKNQRRKSVAKAAGMNHGN
jgi:biopolymer transport protein ExbB